MMGTEICSQFTQGISLTHHLWAQSLCGTSVGWLSCVLQCCLPSSLCFLDTQTFKKLTFASQVSQTVISDIFQKSIGDCRAILTKSIQRTCDPTYSSESKNLSNINVQGWPFSSPNTETSLARTLLFWILPHFRREKYEKLSNPSLSINKKEWTQPALTVGRCC